MLPLLVFLFLFPMLFFTACVNDMEKVKKVTQQDTLPIEVVRDIEVIYSDSGLVQAKLTGPVMEHYLGDNPYIEFPEGVHVEFYDNMMNVESELTSKYAISYENEKKMEARNDVVVINKKGEELKTELLIWEEKTQKIHTPEFVTITTADEIMYGDGFEANQDFTKYKIINIEGTMLINDENSTEDP